MKHYVTDPMERRQFLKVAARYGFGVAVASALGGHLFDSQAVAQTASDEAAKEAAAKVKMNFATEYKIEDWVKYPVMQAKFKENVEQASKNEIFVKLFPAGALGIGAALAQKIQSGTVHGGAVSLSNFSPFTPIVDMINIPYWCGENQKFANLVTSAAWNDEITPKVMEKGYKPMFYYTVDPRTIASRKGVKPIKTPADMSGIKMRVPPSAMLQQIYKLAGANPTVVAWGETAAAIKQGVADALDPAITALATFGFHDILGNVTFVKTVPDAQMFAANAGWYRSLNDAQRKAFDDATAKTQIETFAQIESARKESMRIMEANGCAFHRLSDAEYKQWVDACGEQKKEWDEFKVKLAGSLDNFEKYKKAANTKGPITVTDM
ncbi:MAG TPA: TRAP transporter substrate-binding protein [Beijerinckiaceae bacterium]|nr:TRAP transporter substrate-binding protein [Beijerinckiaceae bacterium]